MRKALGSTLGWLVAWTAYPGIVVLALLGASALLDGGVSIGAVTSIAFVAVLLLTMTVERLRPRRPGWPPGVREVGRDLAFVGIAAASQLVGRLLGQLVATSIALALAYAFDGHAWAASWPTWLRIAIALLLADLAKYWLHRLAHERPWWWRFHATHHAPRGMYALNSTRLHPVNILWNVGLDALTPFVLGLDARAVVMVAVFRGAVSVLQHANADLRFGPLNWIFSTPGLHQWHHSAALDEANANYGSTFILWDIVFGTRRLPHGDRQPNAMGVAGEAEALGVWREIARPWSRSQTRAPRAIASVAAIVGVIAIGIPLVVSSQVEASFNRTARASPYHATERARTLHRGLSIVDLHADTLLWGRSLLARGTQGHVDVPRLLDGNVAVQVFSIVTSTPRHRDEEESDDVTLLAIAEAWPPNTWASLTERALHQAATLDGAALSSKGTLAIIRNGRDLARYVERRVHEPSITAGLLAVEGAQALDGDLGNLDRLFDAGVRMIGLAHFTDNDFGGSASGARRIGLTDKGRELVRRMERHHILIDLAHASPRTIDDVLAIATRPLVVSHTGVRATCDSDRNLSDVQLAAIAKTGGVIGIGFWPHATCGPDAAAVARAIRHAVAVAGIDHVALGSDFDGATTQPFDASGMVEITDALLAEGFGDDDIARIMGGNALRVLAAGLPP